MEISKKNEAIIAKHSLSNSTVDDCIDSVCDRLERTYPANSGSFSNNVINRALTFALNDDYVGLDVKLANGTL